MLMSDERRDIQKSAFQKRPKNVPEASKARSMRLGERERASARMQNAATRVGDRTLGRTLVVVYSGNLFTIADCVV